MSSNEEEKSFVEDRADGWDWSAEDESEDELVNDELLVNELREAHEHECEEDIFNSRMSHVLFPSNKILIV